MTESIWGFLILSAIYASHDNDPKMRRIMSALYLLIAVSFTAIKVFK
jgi:hypothetical protein